MNRVRLSGGELRGRSLAVGPGVRPTEGRVREALFSIWGPDLVGARVLDLFAGSGAVGIEAVGRGAESSLLVEGSPGIVRSLTRSVAELSLEDRVSVLRQVLPAGLSRLEANHRRSFDLIFADPPYRYEDHAALLTGVGVLLKESGEVVIEHSNDGRELHRPAGWTVTDQRVYGDCALTFLRPDER